jgi:hypothetical protein
MTIFVYLNNQKLMIFISLYIEYLKIESSAMFVRRFKNMNYVPTTWALGCFPMTEIHTCTGTQFYQNVE